MKKNKYVFHIAIWAIVLLFLIGILVNGTLLKENLSFLIFSPFWALESKSTALKYTNEYEIELLNDEKIEFNLNVDDLEIEHYEGNIIKIIEKCNYELEESEMLKIDRKLDSLNIVRDDNSFRTKRNSTNRVLHVYLPKEYKQKLEIYNNVGDISINSDLVVEELKINQNVGDLKINYVDTNFYELKSHVGDIDIDCISGYGEISSDIGSINCKIEEIKGDISIESNTGDVKILIDSQRSFDLYANAEIGDFKSNLEFNDYIKENKVVKGICGNNPKHELRIKSGTGDIKVNEK